MQVVQYTLFFVLLVSDVVLCASNSSETTVQFSGAQRRREHGEILARILDPAVYNPSVHPTPESGGPAQVRIQLVVVNLLDMDEKAATFSIAAWLRLAWNDPRLTWNKTATPSTPSHVWTSADPAKTAFAPYRPWVPDLEIENYVTRAEVSDVTMEISAEGNVFLSRRITVRASCDFDLSDYPYETQYCNIRVFSWSLSKADFEMLPYNKNEPNTLDLRQYSPHPEWELTSDDGPIRKTEWSNFVIFMLECFMRSLKFIESLWMLLKETSGLYHD